MEAGSRRARAGSEAAQFPAEALSQRQGGKQERAASVMAAPLARAHCGLLTRGAQSERRHCRDSAAADLRRPSSRTCQRRKAPLTTLQATGSEQGYPRAHTVREIVARGGTESYPSRLEAAARIGSLSASVVSQHSPRLLLCRNRVQAAVQDRKFERTPKEWIMGDRAQKARLAAPRSLSTSPIGRLVGGARRQQRARSRCTRVCGDAPVHPEPLPRSGRAWLEVARRTYAVSGRRSGGWLFCARGAEMLTEAVLLNSSGGSRGCEWGQLGLQNTPHPLRQRAHGPDARLNRIFTVQRHQEDAPHHRCEDAVPRLWENRPLRL